MAKDFPFPESRNILLRGLSESDRMVLAPHLNAVTLDRGMVLEEHDKPIRMVYFPLSGVGSMIALGHKGRGIEAGLFGHDGMSAATLVMGGDRSPNETVMQIAGSGLAIEAGRLKEVMDHAPSLQRHLLLFAQALSVQIAQTVLSSGQATLEERLARWLLMCHDRIDGDEILLTHESLSVILSVRRPGVTVGTHLLEGRHLIRARRGRIIVLDRAGLIRAAGEFYGVPEAEYARLLDREARYRVTT